MRGIYRPVFTNQISAMSDKKQLAASTENGKLDNSVLTRRRRQVKWPFIDLTNCGCEIALCRRRLGPDRRPDWCLRPVRRSPILPVYGQARWLYDWESLADTCPGHRARSGGGAGSGSAELCMVMKLRLYGLGMECKTTLVSQVRASAAQMERQYAITRNFFDQPFTRQN